MALRAIFALADGRALLDTWGERRSAGTGMDAAE
jgi:hypothetical protein